MRVTQILGLTLLAPDIQERILVEPTAPRNRSLPEHCVRDVAVIPLWTDQRTLLAIRLPAPPPLPPATSA